MSVNKIIIVGNVGQTPTIRTAGETKVASFTVATTERFKDKEETEWHNVSVFGKLAEVVEKYIDKGTQLYVEGRIKTEKYTDKNGVERTATRVIANTIQMLGGKKESQPTSSAPVQKTVKSTPLPPVDYDTPGDDLPFN
jgi:single-strand DNA-binding protein